MTTGAQSGAITDEQNVVREYFKQHPAFVVTLLYMFLSFCGLVWAIVYYLHFGVNVLEFASIDYFIMAALIGNGTVFPVLAVLALWIANKYGPCWVGLVMVLALALASAIACFQARGVMSCKDESNPYTVCVAFESPAGSSMSCSLGDCNWDRACRLRFVGTIASRAFFYENHQGTSQQGRTLSFALQDVKLIQWSDNYALNGWNRFAYYFCGCH